jgi:hypothetical protein
VPESFLIRTKGGPRPGTKVAGDWTWPLPELLLAEGGAYIKVRESALPPMPDGGRVLRGAEYEWQPGLPTVEQLNKDIATSVRTRRFDEVEGLLLLLAAQDPDAAAAVYDTITLLGESRG